MSKVQPTAEIYDSHAANISNIGVPDTGAGEHTAKIVLGIRNLSLGDYKFEKNRPWEWEILVDGTTVFMGIYDAVSGHVQKVFVDKWTEIGNFILSDPEKFEYGPNFDPDHPEKHFMAVFFKMGFRFNDNLKNTTITFRVKGRYSDEKGNLYIGVFKKQVSGGSGIIITGNHGEGTWSKTIIDFFVPEQDIDDDDTDDNTTTDCQKYIENIATLKKEIEELKGTNEKLKDSIYPGNAFNIAEMFVKVFLKILENWKKKKGFLNIVLNVLNSLGWLALNPIFWILLWWIF